MAIHLFLHTRRREASPKQWLWSNILEDWYQPTKNLHQHFGDCKQVIPVWICSTRWSWWQNNLLRRQRCQPDQVAAYPKWLSLLVYATNPWLSSRQLPIRHCYWSVASSSLLSQCEHWKAGSIDQPEVSSQGWQDPRHPANIQASGSCKRHDLHKLAGNRAPLQVGATYQGWKWLAIDLLPAQAFQRSNLNAG